MDILEVMKSRHSVRQYLSKELDAKIVEALEEEILLCNQKSDLNIQLLKNEPQAFSSMMAKYGKFKNVTNYIALVGTTNDTLEERIGYYGEHLVLAAQQLGLNTCWVAMTYSKNKSKIS